MRRSMILGLIGLAALLFTAPPADARPGRARPRARVVVVTAAPAPVVKARFVADARWVAGHWTWCGPACGYRWVPGHWARR